MLRVALSYIDGRYLVLSITIANNFGNVSKYFREQEMFTWHKHATRAPTMPRPSPCIQCPRAPSDRPPSKVCMCGRFVTCWGVPSAIGGICFFMPIDIAAFLMPENSQVLVGLAFGVFFRIVENSYAVASATVNG